MNSLRGAAIVSVMMTALSLSACASKGVRGLEPFLTMNNLVLDGSEVVLDLGVRNVNSVPINMAHIEFSFDLGETGLAVYNAASNAQVFANGTENLRFRMPATEAGRARLTALQEGELKNIQFRLEGQITDLEGLQLKILREGYLYPVPGRPGQFR